MLHVIVLGEKGAEGTLVCCCLKAAVTEFCKSTSTVPLILIWGGMRFHVSKQIRAQDGEQEKKDSVEREREGERERKWNTFSFFVISLYCILIGKPLNRTKQGQWDREHGNWEDRLVGSLSVGSAASVPARFGEGEGYWGDWGNEVEVVWCGGGVFHQDRWNRDNNVSDGPQHRWRAWPQGQSMSSQLLESSVNYSGVKKVPWDTLHVHVYLLSSEKVNVIHVAHFYFP